MGGTYFVNNNGIFSTDHSSRAQLLCPITNLIREINSERYRVSQVNEAKASSEHNQNSITPELKTKKRADCKNNIIWLSSNYGLFQYNTITLY